MATENPVTPKQENAVDLGSLLACYRSRDFLLSCAGEQCPLDAWLDTPEALGLWSGGLERWRPDKGAQCYTIQRLLFGYAEPRVLPKSRSSRKKSSAKSETD